MNITSEQQLIDWICTADVALQYQCSRDLLNRPRKEIEDLQKRIPEEGWGAQFLARRHPNGHWGKGVYSPKWTSTHYTLLDLRDLGCPRGVTEIEESMKLILSYRDGVDGGVNFAKTVKYSDLCINGMLLNMGAWFLPDHPRLTEIVDYLLEHQIPGSGGWNCDYWQGSKHASLHSTLTVLEGFWEFRQQCSDYRTEELKVAEKKGIEFILAHRLFRSTKTGAVIDPKMLRLSHPPRWRFNILRCLDHFQARGLKYDPRMQDALDIIIKKQRKDGTWPVQFRHGGMIHFDMEKPGGPSRWNSLKVLRIFRQFDLQAPFPKDLIIS